MNDFKIIESIESVVSKGFDYKDGKEYASYKNRINTYYLDALIKLENGSPIGVYAYKLYKFNESMSYKTVIFKFEDNILYVLNDQNEFVQAETLDWVSPKAFYKIRRIILGLHLINRNYVYASPSVHGTCNIVNYKAEANDINSFLSIFDVWRSHGHFKMSEDNNHQEVWFECSKEFFEMLHTNTMQQAFKRMGVELVFDYPFYTEMKKES